jgi:hypothetical protein
MGWIAVFTTTKQQFIYGRNGSGSQDILLYQGLGGSRAQDFYRVKPSAKMLHRR